MTWYNKFDLVQCECRRQLRHRIADEAFGCLTCRQDEAASRASAALSWAMVGEKPVDWSEVAQERVQDIVAMDEVDLRLSRMRRGKDD